MIFNLDDAVRVKTFGCISQAHGAWHMGQRSVYSTAVYCIAGDFRMNVEGEVLCVESGDTLLIPAHKRFVPLEGGACKYYILNFSASVMPAADTFVNNLSVTSHINLKDGHAYSSRGDYYSFSDVKPLTKGVSGFAKAIFDRADKLKPNECFADQLLLDQLAKEFLIRLGNVNRTGCSSRLTEILKYIEQNYSDDLSLGSLSRRFSLSSSYIARIFKKELDCKPSEYVNSIRASVAETLLSTTNMSVGDVSDRVGYSDVYYFSKIFKKIVGVPPSKVR